MISEEMLTALRRTVADYMNEDRYRHTLGVEQEMRRLASVYMPERVAEASAAGLLHDITKSFSYEEQLAYADANGIALDEEERNTPPVIHAKTGAHYVKTHFPAFATEDVLHAIEKHTLADEEMSLFDILLFLADFTEENRTYEDCVALRKRLYDRLPSRMEDKEIFLFEMLADACDVSLLDLIANHRPIAQKTVKARNFALRVAFANRGKK